MYHLVFILATLFGENIYEKKTRILVIVKLKFFTNKK